MDDHGSWIPRRFFAIVLTSGSRRFTKAAISFVPRRHLFSPSFLFFFLSFFFHRWNRRNLSDPAGNSILRNYVFSVSFASVSCPYRTILLRRGLPSKRLEFNRWTTYFYIGGRHLFLLANETPDQKELLFLFVWPKYERILSSFKKSIFRFTSGEIIDLFDSPYVKSNQSNFQRSIEKK